jgi:hypothetical protein
MTPWTAPAGDGEGTIATLIAAVAGGVAIMLWTQRTPSGDPAVEAACALAAAVAAAAAGAGAVSALRRRRGGAAAKDTPAR